MQQVETREGARRQHRELALLCVLQCWNSDLQGIVISRRQFERVLGLERFKATRIAWLLEDLRECFPHVKPLYTTGKKGHLHALYLSRVPFGPDAFRGSMSIDQRIERLQGAGHRVDGLSLWEVRRTDAFKEAMMDPKFPPLRRNYDECFLSSYLMLVAQGQLSVADPPYGASGIR